jgi:hypothetical protein
MLIRKYRFWVIFCPLMSPTLPISPISTLDCACIELVSIFFNGVCVASSDEAWTISDEPESRSYGKISAALPDERGVIMT